MESTALINKIGRSRLHVRILIYIEDLNLNPAVSVLLIFCVTTKNLVPDCIQNQTAVSDILSYYSRVRSLSSGF